MSEFGYCTWLTGCPVGIWSLLRKPFSVLDLPGLQFWKVRQTVRQWAKNARPPMGENAPATWLDRISGVSSLAKATGTKAVS